LINYGLDHKDELLSTYVNILTCESHSEPQTQHLTSLKQGYQKIIIKMTIVRYIALLVPHAIQIMWAKVAEAWNSVSPNIYNIFAYNNPQPVFAKLQHAQEYGPIQNIMTLIQ